MRDFFSSAMGFFFSAFGAACVAAALSYPARCERLTEEGEWVSCANYAACLEEGGGLDTLTGEIKTVQVLCRNWLGFDSFANQENTALVVSTVIGLVFGALTYFLAGGGNGDST